MCPSNYVWPRLNKDTPQEIYLHTYPANYFSFNFFHVSSEEHLKYTLPIFYYAGVYFHFIYIYLI